MKSGDTSSMMGSPYYMSPEQIRSTRTVDHRADIWSLGAVLFELLANATAFSEVNEFTELVAEILEQRHRPLAQYRPDFVSTGSQHGCIRPAGRFDQRDRPERFGDDASLGEVHQAHDDGTTRRHDETARLVIRCAIRPRDPTHPLTFPT